MPVDIPYWVVPAVASVAVFATITLVAQSHFVKKGRVPVGTLLIALAAAASVAVFLWCVVTAPGAWPLALPLYAAALALFLWTVRTTRGKAFLLAFSDAVPSALTVTGPYRFVRNPFYVSYLLYHLGNAVATTSWLPWMMFALMTALYVAAAREEEGYLARGTYAEAYAAYKQRTGMFWPRLSVLINARGAKSG